MIPRREPKYEIIIDEEEKLRVVKEIDEPSKKNNKLKPKPDEEKFVTNIHRMILKDKYSFFHDTGGKAI